MKEIISGLDVEMEVDSRTPSPLRLKRMKPKKMKEHLYRHER